ncbi:MAG TPA: hypothetical protein VK936_08515 [Longimicrobiales bacterium]|nr:hypothetical protein [Longimicrobiales bacterium]
MTGTAGVPASPGTLPPPAPFARTGRVRREPGSRAGWLFIAPALLLIGVFFFVPVVG